MGQASSSSRSSTLTNNDGQAVERVTQSGNDVESSAYTDSPQGSTSAESASTAGKPPKRTAKRRFTDFITSGSKAGTSSRGEGESTVTKKRWRASRRWSTLPASSQPSEMVATPPVEAVSEPTVPASAALESVERMDTDPPHDQSAMDIQERQDGHAVEWSTDALNTAPPVTIVVPTSPSPQMQAELPSMPDIQVTDAVMGPDTLPESLTSETSAQLAQPETLPSSPIAASPVAASPSLPAPRPFPTPTPGTLVVVQGVVQTAPPPPPITGPSAVPTAEPPRPRSLSHGANRNRLSGLFRPLNPSTPTSAPISTPIDPPPYVAPSTAPATAELGDTSLPSLTTDAEGPDNGGPSTTNSISPNSIDVLGALLGFVAASTAASLLTGATMPFDSLNANGASPPSPPTLPNPTRTGMPSDPSADPPIDASRMRLRNAWSSLRDRIGTLGGNAGAGTTSPLPTGSIASEPSAPTGLLDPRRALLDELGRAHGMGRAVGDAPNLTGETAPSSSSSTMSQSPQVSTTASPIVNPARDQNISVNIPLSLPPRLTPPVLGTFERFLFDLQAELRIALTAPTSVDPATSNDQSTGEDMVTTSNPNPTISNSDVSNAPSLERSQRLSSSSIMDISNTSPAPAPDASLRSSTPSAESAEGQNLATPRAHGEINWWRLYRFPAMQIANGRGVPAPVPRSPPAPSSLTTPTTSPSNTTPPDAGISPGSSSSSGLSTDTQTAGPGMETLTPIESVVESIIPPTPLQPSSNPTMPAPPGNTNATQMVPVIVIGIQSVPLGVNNAEEGVGTRTDNATATDVPSAVNPSNTPDDEDRGRPWTSRAAAALRNLRTGRRGGPAQQPEQAGPPGSRMFLIYVIGGYYPPDHHIINSPGSLDLEALWDLADLLSNIKPETVTKTDINNSGLRVIKPAELEKYEKDGQVSNNCVDRCLICLDDYEPDTDIRVLTCKHAFHQNCVDTWLSTGKNNCPACRTTGVVNPSSPSSSQS